jgi:tetratricopeptide (TPR) repeat protein
MVSDVGYKKSPNPIWHLGFLTALTFAVVSNYSFSLPSFADYTNPAFDKGVRQMSHRNFDDAILSFNEAIGTAATDSLAYFRRGQCFYFLQNFKLALSDFTQAINNNPKKSEYYLWRGTAHAKLGQDDFAIRDYERAINLDPQLKEAYAKGGGEQQHGGPANEGRLALRKRGERGANERRGPEYNVELSEIFVTRPRFKTPEGEGNNAIKDYKEAMRRVGHATTAFFNTGTIYSGLSEPEHEVSNPSSAAQVAADMEQTTKDGKPFYSLKNPRKVLKDYVAAIDVEPNKAANYFQRARAYWQLGDRTNALRDFNRALDLDTWKAEYYLARAYFYYQDANMALAQDDLKRAQDLDPALPRIISFQPSKEITTAAEHPRRMRRQVKANNPDVGTDTGPRHRLRSPSNRPTQSSD